MFLKGRIKFLVLLTSCFSCFSSAALSLVIALCVPLNSRFCSFIISGKKIFIAGKSFQYYINISSAKHSADMQCVWQLPFVQNELSAFQIYEILAKYNFMYTT